MNGKPITSEKQLLAAWNSLLSQKFAKPFDKLLDEVFNTWRLRINTSKTKTMILNEIGEYASTIASLKKKL